MSSDNTCPCIQYAHFTANQSILEAFTGKTKVHVIDFSIKKGNQWPPLMQALALRQGGPPTFRLTSIGSPSSDSTDHLQEVGSKLALLADTINMQFEYKSIFVAENLADLEPAMLGLKEGEAVAINSVFDLHQLLARTGAVEKVFTVVKEMKPEVFTVVETCGNVGASNIDMGKHTCSVFGCEGLGQVELHQSTLTQWKTRFEAGRFKPFHLGSNAYKQASMLLKLFSNVDDGYRVEENEGCLMLCWYTWPLIMTSAWKL